MATHSAAAASSMSAHDEDNKPAEQHSVETKKRPRSELFQRNDSELPEAGVPFSVTNNTQDTSRVRKKKKKKALQQQELILFFAQNSQFTNSVFLDMPNKSSKNSADIIAAQQQQQQQQQSIKITTSATLPTTLNQQFHFRPLQIQKPIQIYVQPLIILDLNGILCHRIRPRKEPRGVTLSYRTATLHVANTHIIPRTNLEHFLTYLNSHFCLAVWTSAQPKTMKKLVEALFPESVTKNLLFCWGQNRCHSVQHNPDGGGEMLFEKSLDKVWEEFPLWNQFNTLLVDDSPDKCSSFRHNALHPPPLHGQQQAPRPLPGFQGDDSNVVGGIGAGSDTHDFLRDWMSDEENHDLQMGFFTKLVDYWKTNTSETTWNELGEIQCNKESESVWNFLEENAMDHMGWRM